MDRVLAKNALANLLQMGLNAVLLFILYRYLTATLGVAKLGIWSVVLATTSVSAIGDLGLSASVTRFVAKYLTLTNPKQAASVVETGTVSLAVVLALLLPAVYPLLVNLIGYLFDAENLHDALAILPYAMFSLWVSILAAIFQSGLDGCQRMDVRMILVSTGQALLLALAFWLVPRFGLIGLVWAQVGQALYLLIFGWWILRRRLHHLSWLPWRWRMETFKEMLRYGINVQFGSLCMMLFDPLTKALMAKFGGATTAGYFEMANQIVLRARALIVAANKAVIPMVAQVNEVSPEGLSKVYQENMRLLIFVILPIFSLLMAWAGFFSWLLLRGHQTEFIFILQIVGVAWALNTFAAPAYYFNMGTGRVGWNTLSHVVMGGLNGMLGWILGTWFGANGVAWGYAAALVLGSWFLIVVFHRLYAIPWRVMAPSEHLGLAAACMAVLAFSLFKAKIVVGDHMLSFAIDLLVPSFMIGFGVWLHPLRKHLWIRLSTMYNIRPAKLV